MDADATIAAIVALQTRAEEYTSSAKSGYAAAAEKLQEAVVLAQCLPGLSEDNLVALSLQVECCKHLCGQAWRMHNLSGSDTDDSRRFHAAASSSLLLATAALYRHLDAGTLQPGRCAPLEEAWYVAYSTKVLYEMDKSKLLRFGQFVGIAALYDAAQVALADTIYLELLSFGSVQHQELLSLIVRAFDSLCKPRPLDETPLICEVMLVHKMLEFQKSDTVKRIAVSRDRALFSQVEQIWDAWARVQADGVLQRRGLHVFDVDLTSAYEQDRRNLEAANARQARRGLRSCGLASCGAKEAHVSHFKGCGACKTVFYCCREHQLEDWPAHKAACKAARKAAAADDKQ